MWIPCIVTGGIMTNYRVAEIWRYPVKSMQGERLAECMLTKGGIPLDRGWAAVSYTHLTLPTIYSV